MTKAGLSIVFTTLFATGAVAMPPPPATPVPEPAPAPAPPPVNLPASLRLQERVDYLDVRTDSLESFVSAVRAREFGVADADSRTISSLQVRYRLEPEGSGCRAVGLSIVLDIAIRKPRWLPPEVVRPTISEQWERMRIGIERHETGHRDLAVEAAVRLAENLEMLATREDLPCDALDRAIVRERIKSSMRHQNLDAAYDKRTRHGLAQAPPPPAAPEPRGPRDFRDRGEGRDLGETNH